MPYSYKYKRQSYGRRRQNYRRRGSYRASAARYGYFGKFGSQASAAYSMAKKALSFINPEFKEINVQSTAAAISSTPTQTLLNGLVQGDTDTTRDGSQIRMTTLLFRGFLTVNTTAVNCMVRILIVMDRQANGALYATGGLLNDTTVNDSIVSAYNIDNKYRLHVLWDQRFALSTTSSNAIVPFEFFHKFSNTHVRYDANNGDITDIQTNSLTVFLVSNEATNTPTITFYSRVRFLDN